VEKVNFGMLMETFTKDNGMMIKQMEKVFIIIQMEQNIKDNGTMIFNKD